MMLCCLVRYTYNIDIKQVLTAPKQPNTQNPSYSKNLLFGIVLEGKTHLIAELNKTDFILSHFGGVYYKPEKNQ